MNWKSTMTTLCLINKEIKAKCLTHWGRVTHICVGKLTSISSDNGLSPGRRQAIIWTNAGILLIRPLGTNFSEINFSEISIEIYTFSFKKMHLKTLSAKWRLFCLGLNELTSEWKWVLLILLTTEADITTKSTIVPLQQIICPHLGLVSNICMVKNSSPLPGDAYMYLKSIYFSNSAGGNW